MLKHSLCAAAAAIALSACASNGAQSTAGSAPAAMAAPEAPPPPAASTPETAAPPAASAGAYTDVQLRSFAAASHDIAPLNAQLTSSDAATKSAAVAQVRAILARNNLDSATYNAIAAQAQADPAFAARIAALGSTSSHG
jgi:hypothetical protein